MPPGAPFDSFILPYPIRVDAFATPNGAPDFKSPTLYLLTHTHSDHTVGLNAKSFGGVVVCSETAKEMLLRVERLKDRINYDTSLVRHKTRPYSHLRIEPTLVRGKLDYAYARDLLRAIPLDKPTKFDLSAELTVWITAIDANHCPGAVMFLVEGPYGAVLHTGDVRAEPWFIESLTRNPTLQRFIPHPQSVWPPPKDSPIQVLEAVYIDTAMLMNLGNLPSKEEAVSDLVQLLELYDPSTKFFLNTWTWGYEEILKAVARRFDTQIHVDRYKADIYRCGNDLFLKSIVTTKTNTRFHACEKHNRCPVVLKDDMTVVYVNPTEMSAENWKSYKSEARKRLLAGEKLGDIIVPFSRHSGLVELQTLTNLFRPKNVIPNFLCPAMNQIDWICMPNMFEHCIAPGGADQMRRDIQNAIPSLDHIFLAAGEPKNIALENVEGDGAKQNVLSWSSKEQFNQRDALLAKLAPFLPEEMCVHVQEGWGGFFDKRLGALELEEGGGSSDDECDKHSQGWRAVALGLKPGSRIKVSRIEGAKDAYLRKPRLLVVEGSDGGRSAKPPLSNSRKRNRDKEDASNDLPSKKKRHISPEVIVIDDSSPSPSPVSHRKRLHLSHDHRSGKELSERQSALGVGHTKLGSAIDAQRTRELKSKIILAKTRSSAGDRSATFAVGDTSRLSAAWGQGSSKVIQALSQEAEGQPLKQASTTLTEHAAVALSSNEEGLALPPGIDLSHTRSLLNQLIAGNKPWGGLRCVGSQTQPS